MHPSVSQQLARARQDALLGEAEKTRPPRKSRDARGENDGQLRVRWMRRSILVEEARCSCETAPW